MRLLGIGFHTLIRSASFHSPTDVRSQKVCNTRVKERYMNEPKLCLNKSKTKNRRTKKCLKELKVTTCINKVYLLFR